MNKMVVVTLLILLTLSIGARKKHSKKPKIKVSKIEALFRVYLDVNNDSMMADIKASKRARTAIMKLAPDSKFAYYIVAEDTAQFEGRRQAIKLLNKVIKKFPKFSDGYTQRGLLRVGYSNKEAKRAVEDFNKAIELNEKDGRAYAGLAEAYRQMGKIEKSCNNYFISLNFGLPVIIAFDNICEH